MKVTKERIAELRTAFIEMAMWSENDILWKAKPIIGTLLDAIEERDAESEKLLNAWRFLNDEVLRMGKTIEKWELFAKEIMNWRADACEYDVDMGHEPRDFSDEEWWDQIEDHAATTLVDLQEPEQDVFKKEDTE
jgi:hypothetical protein